MTLSVGIVGGGINGMVTAWALAKAGHAVTVYEQNTACPPLAKRLQNCCTVACGISKTSRSAWLKTPCKSVCVAKCCSPIGATPATAGAGHKKSRRSCWAYALGLKLYDLLASNNQTSRSKWHSRQAVLNKHPSLNSNGLLGAYSF